MKNLPKKLPDLVVGNYVRDGKKLIKSIDLDYGIDMARTINDLIDCVTDLQEMLTEKPEKSTHCAQCETPMLKGIHTCGKDTKEKTYTFTDIYDKYFEYIHEPGRTGTFIHWLENNP